MVYMLVRLKIENYSNWKTFFHGRSETRKEAGSKKALLFRNSDKRDEAVILFNWDNKENAQKYTESGALRKMLQKEGAKIISMTYLDEPEKTI
jgi:quinol monooxygenase YgiN